MSRRNSISKTEETVEMIEQSEVKKRRTPPSIQIPLSMASPSSPNSQASPVSPFVRHETILTIQEEKTPVITAIKIDRSTYIRIVFVGAASAFMNSSAVGLGIYNLLTSSVDSGGYGIAIDPTTGGILAFFTTGVLFTSVSYNLCHNDIRTLQNLKQDVQRIEVEKNSKKTSLDKQKTRFIKYALMFHQNNFTNDQKESEDFLKEKAEEFLLKNKISYKHNNLTQGIIELYDKITTEHPEKKGHLTMEDFQNYLELHPSILEDLFPLTESARIIEQPQSCRRSLCSTLTSYFFVPVNTILNLLGAVSLTAGQSAQASGSNLSPTTMISTTSVTSILGGVFIYWGTARTQKEISQLEQQKQADLQAIDDHKSQTAAFSQLATFAKSCSSELDQKALIQSSEEQKKQLELVTKQLSEEKTDNLRLKTQLDEEKAENRRLRVQIQALQNPRQAETEYKTSQRSRRSNQPEITPLRMPREERFSPISGVSSPRSPISFVESCTVRKSPEPSPAGQICIIS